MMCQPNAHDLHQAILAGSASDVQEILDINTANIKATVCGATPLSLTLYKEKTPLFKMIITHRHTRELLDVNVLSKDDKIRLEPALVTACRLGNREAVTLLLKHPGIDLERTDSFRHAGLWMASRQRCTDLVKMLIEAGASVNPSDLSTRSPLFLAVEYSSKRKEIAKHLVYNGANLDIRKGQSLLYYAVMSGEDIARIVIEAGYNASCDEKVKRELATGMMTRNISLIDMLEYEIHNAPSLLRQCRTVIRNTVSKQCHGKHFLEKLESLPLPVTVLDHLTLRPVIKFA